MTPTRLATAALTAIALVVALAVAAPAHADPVVATGSAGDVTAWDGGLAWSVRTAPGTFALMVLRGQVATRAPIAPDSEPFYATTGTDHNGDPVLVYVRCRGGCNAAYAYWPASGTERRLVHAGHGCQVRDPSIDHGALSFVRYMRSCRARGVLRRSASGAARRLTAGGRECCTATLRGATAWMGETTLFADTPYPISGLTITVAPARARRFFLFAAGDVAGATHLIAALQAAGGLLYWSVAVADAGGLEHARVYRAKLVPRAACQGLDRDLPGREDDLYGYAVSATGLWYLDHDRVLAAVDPPPTYSTDSSFYPLGELGPGCGNWDPRTR